MAGSIAARTLTIVAAGFLGFDGTAVAGLGLWVHNFTLTIVGVALFLSSGLVLWYWRWHQRQLAEIAAARAALRDEARRLLEVRGER